MYLNSRLYGFILVCTIVSVFFLPVFADNETVAGDSPGSVDLISGQQAIITPSETPIPGVTPGVTTVTGEPAIIPTTTEVTSEPTEIPPTLPLTVPTTEVTSEPTTTPTTTPVTVEPTDDQTPLPTTTVTTMVTPGPTTVPATTGVTVEPTAVPTLTGTPAGNESPADPVNTTVLSQDNTAGNETPACSTVTNPATEQNQSSGSPVSGDFNLSWTANLTDPPLNTTNLQGTTGEPVLGDQCDHRFQWLLSPRPCRSCHQFPVRDLDP